jgi:hypothetical protein
MLKYQPKHFWGMLGTSNNKIGVTAQKFAMFNEKLYYDANIPVDQFKVPEPVNIAKIDPAEVKRVLEYNYPANRSTGLSKMPTQCIKWLGQKVIPTIADFLNKSAIEQLAPESWRASKVVPLYKGEGDSTDCNNYRSIAVAPPFAKLFMSIIN